MNPAFEVRLRPSGPWRIGVDSGARDRVDRIFHSDALFSAVSQAMLRLGQLEEWLAATAGAAGEPAVRLSSLFPFLDDIQFVPPPRSWWPPPPSPKVRWRNARFVPLSLVRDLVAEKTLHDNRWFLDGDSGCLLPSEPGERSGPFRMALRSHAAVDRVSGSAVEIHRTACLEFAPGAGLWGVVSFADEEAEARWSEPVRAAFRVLADTGFGGERSLGWGRSAQPEFVAGTLPDLIVPEPVRAPLPPAPPVRAAVHTPTALELLREYTSPKPAAEVEPAAAEPPAPVEAEPSVPEPAVEAEPGVSEPAPESEPVVSAEEPASENAPPSAAEAEPAEPEPSAEIEPPAPEPISEAAPEPVPETPKPAPPPRPVPVPAPKRTETGYWLLSMFSPAQGDSVDWQRGSYTLAERGGRIDSPVRAGEVKKIARMVEEGSVLLASAAPRGAAPDVAPDGFPHPVFRCGFALAVAIPVRGDR
jgi:CRISPR type III-A-associated RAMP protein Csm4